MKKTVKFLALILVFALLAPALAGCGTKPPAAPTPGQSASQSTAQPSAPAEQKYELVWASTSASSGYYALNVAMANVINEYVDNVTVTVMETGGTADDFRYMRDGQASFGQTTDTDTYLIQNDMGTYQGYDYPDARMLVSCFPLLYYMTVSQKSGINSIADLQGATFSAGLAGSSTEQDIMKALEACNIVPDWYPASTGDAVDAMKNRQLSGFCKSGSVVSGDSSIMDVMTSIDVRVLSWSEEEQAAVLAANPYMAFSTISGKAMGLDYDITSLSKFFGFSVDADLPDEVVYNIIKAIDEHQNYLHETYGGLGDYDIIEMTGTVGSALLHPGVVKYLQEKGYTIDPVRIPS